MPVTLLISAAEIRLLFAIRLQAVPMFIGDPRYVEAVVLLHLKSIEENFNRLLTTSIG
jgi:hypothetical protein